MPSPAQKSRQLIEPIPASQREWQARLDELMVERDRLVRQRRRNLMLAGISLSLCVHVLIMWYLSSILQQSQAPGPPTSVYVEFAALQDEELTEMDSVELDSDSPDALSDLSELPDQDPLLDLDVSPPVAELEVGNTGAMPTLSGGGSGSGGGLSLGGGGAGTSFFNIKSTGRRFCFIVDISGSMQDATKLRTALREVARSIDSLPDFAEFYVILFSSGLSSPPWQDDWVKAREREVTKLIGWLERVNAGGGTVPYPAFARALGLENPPDVIFFLTDGQIPANTDAQVGSLNKAGARAVINTIAFGDPRSQDQLKKIARESGGLYRLHRINRP